MKLQKNLGESNQTKHGIIGGYMTSACNLSDKEYDNASFRIFDKKDEEIFSSILPILRKNGYMISKFNPNNPNDLINFNSWDMFKDDCSRIVSTLLISSYLSIGSDMEKKTIKISEWDRMGEILLESLIYHLSTSTDNNLKGLEKLLNLKYEELNFILKNSESSEARKYYNKLLCQIGNDNEKMFNAVKITLNERLSIFFYNI